MEVKLNTKQTSRAREALRADFRPATIITSPAVLDEEGEIVEEEKTELEKKTDSELFNEKIVELLGNYVTLNERERARANITVEEF